MILEDELSGEFPLSVHLYRPIRQKVYGILYSYYAVKEEMRQKDGSGDVKEGKTS